MEKRRVLVVCSRNSARSQTAGALIRHKAGDGFEVSSAGTHPASVRVEAAAVMRELGIDHDGVFLHLPSPAWLGVCSAGGYLSGTDEYQ